MNFCVVIVLKYLYYGNLMFCNNLPIFTLKSERNHRKYPHNSITITIVEKFCRKMSKFNLNIEYAAGEGISHTLK